MTRSLLSLSLVFCGVLLLGACGDDPAPKQTTPEEMPDDVTGTDDDPRCPKAGSRRPLSLPQLICPRAFKLVATSPDTTLFANTASVKFVIDLQDDAATYFMDGLRYDLHYTFCKANLDKPGFDPVGTHAEFNQYQYRGTDRRFLLGTITYYGDSGVVALEFATGDAISAEQVLYAYRHLTPLLYFGDKLVYRPISLDHERAAAEELEGLIPIITTEDLYAGITYQPLNVGAGYGYLRLIDGSTAEGVRPTDLVVLREAPNDLRPVAGVITEAFQTPLSHVNILSKNRQTPNMALRGVFDLPEVRALEGKLVYLEVQPQRWILREATLAEAEPYWEGLRPAETFVPPLDLSVGGLPDLSTLDRTAINIIGAKASNMAEMTHIDPPVPLPDQPFAIPFSHYWGHMERNGLLTRRDALLADPRFESDLDWRARELQALREAIVNAPMDPDLLALLYARVRARWGTAKTRFRSSTNSEDLEHFNGAGLYRSESGQVEGGRPLEDAVRYVWSSLWTDEAVAERDFYRIDHKAVAMAVLVHPSVPDEAANGVALTVNLFNPRRPGFFINVQEGEASVTNPGPGEVPDQLILYTWYDEPEAEYLSYSTLTEDGEPVLSWPETLALYDALLNIHTHFRAIYDPERKNREFGMDVEFKLLKPDRRLQIKQARPIPGAR